LPDQKPLPRLVNLQILRAVAATLVVWAHSVDVSLIPGGHKPILASGNLENFGAFGVDIFFVISGFIISASSDRNDRNWQDFIKDRFVRVAPIFYLLSLPWLFVAMAKAESFRLSPIVPNLLFWPVVQGNFVEPYLTVGWTLSFEALFYGALAVAISGRNLIGRPSTNVILFFIATICLQHFVPTATLRFLGNPIILEFLFGIMIGRLFAYTGPQRMLAVGAIAVALALLAYQLVFGFGDISESQFIESGALSFRRALMWGVPAALIVYAALLAGNNSGNALKQMMAYLGDASYSLYLVHLLVMAIFKALQKHGIVSGDVLILTSIGSSLIAGAIVYRYIERPLIKALRTRFAGSGDGRAREDFSVSQTTGTKS
jgi:exopolysaccharide production protein ExoZ